MRDYDPERDDWTHRVQPRQGCRMDQRPNDRDPCRNGMEHEYAAGECVMCEAQDPYYDDDPRKIHYYDPKGDHVCFAGCRHARTKEGRYLRPRPYEDDQ